MASNYIFSDNGVIIPDTADIQTTVQEEFKAVFGQGLSLEESTPQGRLIDVETTARQSVINFNANIANSLINISMSSGSALDAWGANFDIPRNGVQPSRVSVVATGVPDTVIPANSEAVDKKGIIWKSESEIIIGENGTSSGEFLCSQTGAIELGIGELDTIVASSTVGIDGWETITNITTAIVGSAKESDAAYKLRILNSLFNGTALFGNYASACYKVDNVLDVFTYDNPYGTARQLDDITIPPHSVYVCVDGGNTEDIAYALYGVKSAGCGWCGNTTVTITDKDYNTKNTVIFNIPQDIDFSIDIETTSLLNSSANLENDIKNTIVNYFNNAYQSLGYSKVGIRALIDPFVIAALLKSQNSGISVNSVKVGLATPQAHATANIIKASVTSGIEWASVNTEIFKTQITGNGTYNFIYNGENWTLNNEEIQLTDYGISATGTPITNDKVSILYANGELAQTPIMLYVTEKAIISSENITVTING